ncbi:hypothetical protein KIM67_11110 [Flagellimonas sp. 389]|nr:hypothetical protein [uncultured Allomuricauda sp.]MBS9462963.1 hypothetical protein [Flagellimonas sp. 389]
MERIAQLDTSLFNTEGNRKFPRCQDSGKRNFVQMDTRIVNDRVWGLGFWVLV